MKWIHSEHNPLYEGNHPFAQASVREGAGPSVVSVINDLMCGRIDEAMEFLRRAPMDNGIACESVDAETGIVVDGPAYASCAGYLAFGLGMALNASPPETSKVKTKGTARRNPLPAPARDQARHEKGEALR